MSSTRVRKPEPCAHEDCGSKRFHIGNDGYTYCDQGHQQSERGTIVAEDDGENLLRGRKTRRKDSDAESRTSRASSFTGADAFEYYLLCLQIVLRKQLRWLIDVQKLPNELEMLTKDLWAVRLQKLQHAVTFESETDTEGLSSQVFSSQSESEGARSSASSRRKQSVNRRPKEGTPNLLDTICLCYTAILFLRIPVTVADIHGWVNEGELLYYRASRETPLEMKERLPPRYQLLLDSQDLLPPERLHQNVLETLTVLNKDFGMAIPSLNVPLILYRWIKDLALPLEIYAGTQRLAKILKVDVGAFLATETAANVVLRYSEARLMAVLVVATKLLFPLDKISRRCQQATDLSALTFDWDAWVELHQAKDRKADHKPLTFKRAFEFSEADCLEAADHTLDAYLDWYENNIASEEIREHGRNAAEIDFRQTLFTMFPVRSDREAVKSAHISIQSNTERDDLGQAQHPLFHERAVLGTAIPKSNQIGSFYRRYRSVEDLSGPAKVLVERAASSAGVSLESMVRAVFLTEKKLQKHEEHLRKGGRTRS